MGVVIGPLSATPFRRIESSTCSGSGLPPYSSITSVPACCTSQSNSTPVASRTRRVASVSSGPVPSPGIKVTRWGTGSDSIPGVAGSGPGRFLSVSEFKAGLEGVGAVETEIAEPDREGGQLRYRGVDIEELVGTVPFENVWGLLVDEALEPGLPAAYCELEVRTGGHMSDLQSMLAILSGRWKLGQLIDIGDEQAKEDLRRLSAAALSIVAQAARGV